MNRVLAIIVVLVLSSVAVQAEGSQGKYAIILQAGNEANEGMARAVHALLYARELAEKDYQVALIFDGAGAGWANELRKPENPLHKHYLRVQKLGVVEEICDYCAEAFDVKKKLPEKQRELLVGDYEGHPSITRWIEKGYRLIVL